MPRPNPPTMPQGRKPPRTTTRLPGKKNPRRKAIAPINPEERGKSCPTPIGLIWESHSDLMRKTTSPGELDVIVLVNNAELARYLNFCEGKAHLDLLGSREINQKLKDHGYKPRVKHLVKSLPVELRALLAPDITAPDTGVFDAFFPKPTGRSGDPKPRGRVDPIPPPLPPAPRMFMVDELPDGFRVRGNPEFAGWPVNARIMVAYADGSRRPSWSQLDFKLNDLNIRYSGCRISTDRNIIRLLEFGPGAEVKVTGFDANRELDTSIRRIRSDAQAN